MGSKFLTADIAETGYGVAMAWDKKAVNQNPAYGIA
jgi:hypothetical protein